MLPVPARLLLLLTLFLVLAFPVRAQETDPVVAGPDQPAATTAAERLGAFSQRRALEAASLVAEIPFRSAGPTVMSGRVADVEGRPGDPSTFYVAYASGGLWVTTNGGASFMPLFDDQPAITLGDIAVDWRDPEGDGPTIWAGTGESNSSRSSYAGTGVTRSTDGGRTWSPFGLTESHHIGRIVLHPTDANTAWVAALGPLYTSGGERGVYKTTDGGQSWVQVLDSAERTPDTGAVDLLVDARVPDRLWAATWTRTRRAWDFREGGPGSAIWRSDDAGDTWRRVTDEASGFPVGVDVGRIGLAQDARGHLVAVVDNQARRPADPEEETPPLTREMLRTMDRGAFLTLAEDAINAFLDANNFPSSYTAESVLEMVREGRIEPLALVEFLEDANRDLFETPVIGPEVYRSDDGGDTWTRTHESTIDDLFYSYGYYFGQVRAAPDDPDRLYILGVPLVASSDGGRTWARADGPQVHVDHHALWLDPTRPGYLISGNDGGVNVSYDAGDSWSVLNTPSVGQFYTVAVDEAEPYNIYGGLQDNGVWVGPSDYEASTGWRREGAYPYRRLLGGDGMQVQVDERDGTVYTGFQFGNYVRTHRSERVRAASITPRHDLGERPLRFNWQTPIWLSRHLPDVLYLGSHRVHRSLDRGESWEALSGDLTDGGVPGDVPYGTTTSLHESPLEFGLLAAGTDDGHVWIGEGGGRAWREAPPAWPAGLWVSRVEWSRHDRDRMVVSLNGYRADHFEAYVYRSDDAGRSWTRLGTDLPAEPVNVVREDPANPDVLYVGTDGGLYVSLDRGATFGGMRGQRARAAEGGPGPDASTLTTLPAVPVHDVVIQEREADLVVATHGRSMWIADLKHLQQLTPAVRAEPLHVFAPDSVRHREDWGDLGWTWAERPTEATVHLTYWTTTAGTASIRVVDEAGEPVHAFTDAAEPGLNLAPYRLVADRPLGEDAERGESTDRYYLVPGTYRVEVTLGDASAETDLVVTPAPPPRSRARRRTP